MRKYLVSLWGSRGLVCQVTKELKSNPLAAIMYLLSMIAPAVWGLWYWSAQSISERLSFWSGIELTILMVVLLTIGLYLWTRPAVTSGFLKRLAIVLLATGLLNFALGIFLNYLSFITYDVLAIFGNPWVLFSHVSMVLSLPVQAYLICLTVQVPLAKSVTLRVPLRIFVAVVIMILGINIFGIIAAAILASLQLTMWIQLLFVITSPLRVLVFIAAMTAFSRHLLQVKIDTFYSLKDDGQTPPLEKTCR